MRAILQKVGSAISSLLLIGASACAQPLQRPSHTAQTSTQPFSATAASTASVRPKSYLGFDQNLYPGDAALPALHRTFAFTGYWLNAPPGMDHSEWSGKRTALARAGFGFMLLFNGRLYRDLRHKDAAALGKQDATEAAQLAREQGFPAHSLLFLDMEEGGRMLPEQLAYIGAWLKGVRENGFRAGVYCSGIAVPDGPGHTISTARDLDDHFPGTALWIANDATPPSPGCVAQAISPTESGFRTAFVWQFAQSPERRQYTGASADTYSADGNCYAPELPHSLRTALDLDTSNSPDPSGAR